MGMAEAADLQSCQGFWQIGSAWQDRIARSHARAAGFRTPRSSLRLNENIASLKGSHRSYSSHGSDSIFRPSPSTSSSSRPLRTDQLVKKMRTNYSPEYPRDHDPHCDPSATTNPHSSQRLCLRRPAAPASLTITASGASMSCRSGRRARTALCDYSWTLRSRDVAFCPSPAFFRSRPAFGSQDATPIGRGSSVRGFARVPESAPLPAASSVWLPDGRSRARIGRPVPLTRRMSMAMAPLPAREIPRRSQGF